GGPVTPGLQNVGGCLGGVRDRAGGERLDVEEPDVEGCDDPEVALAASDGPEQVLLVFWCGHPQLAVGGDDFESRHVVRGVSVESTERGAQPTAERVTDGSDAHR